MNILEAQNLYKKYPSVGKTAIDNLSFSIKRGSRLGIIGKNGSGKSTLLKILSGVIKPSNGRVIINGKINSILDIGDHFVNDLTGKDNAKLFLKLKGIENKLIDRHLDNIKDFSELDYYFNLPIKTYSNGMKLRLGIACSIEVPSDILIIDEVFSAGDAHFKLKVNDFLQQKINSEISIVFVSHNPEEILENCTECIWLENGKIRELGQTKDVIENYYLTLARQKSEKDYNLASENDLNSNFIFQPKSNDLLSVTNFHIEGLKQNKILTFDKPINFKIEFTKKSTEVTLHSQIIIHDYQMRPIMMITQHPGSESDILVQLQKKFKGKYTYVATLKEYMLTFGNYYAELKFGKNISSEKIHNEEAMKLDKIHFKIEKGKAHDWTGANEQVFVKPMCEWEITALNREEA
jgi:lipopolysaccharide transport system ATP-binding protein